MNAAIGYLLLSPFVLYGALNLAADLVEHVAMKRQSRRELRALRSLSLDDYRQPAPFRNPADRPTRVARRARGRRP